MSSPRRKLTREEKAKGIAVSSSPARDETTGEPLEDFSLLRDCAGLDLAQRSLIADSVRMERGDDDGNTAAEILNVPLPPRRRSPSPASIGSPVRSASTQSAGRSPARPQHSAEVEEAVIREPPRLTRGRRTRAKRSRKPRLTDDDLRPKVPTHYFGAGVFEREAAIPVNRLRPANRQSWPNDMPTWSTIKSVEALLVACNAVGVTYLIPTEDQRPWSPPVGYQCVYESYFEGDTKLWFPIPRLVTSYVSRRDLAISQMVNGALRTMVALMVMAAEIDVSLCVYAFEQMTGICRSVNGHWSVRMRKNYNIITGHPDKTEDWNRWYFYVKSDQFAFVDPPGDEFRVLWNMDAGS